MRIEGRVGVPRYNDDQEVPIRIGSLGEIMSNDMNGFFAEQVMRGYGYVFTTALAGNALVAATTSNAPAIWNPPTSNKMLVLQKTTFGRTAKGTPLEGSIVYLSQASVKGIGTGADIISGTPVAAKNLRLDLGDQSGMQFYPTTVSTTFTPGVLAASSIAQTADNGATTTVGPRAENIVDWIYGSIILFPGTYLSLGAAVSISTTYTISIYALSLPLPQIA